MLKADPVQLNFYSKYNRAKQKQNINSLYHLIDNNVENIKHIEQLTIVVNGSRKGSVNNSPDRVLEEEPAKRSQLSLGKQKMGKLFQQSRRKEKTAHQRKKRMQFLDQIFIRHDPIERQLIKNKATEKIFKGQTQPKRIEGSNVGINILKPQPQLLILGSHKPRYNFVAEESSNKGQKGHLRQKYQRQSPQIADKHFLQTNNSDELKAIHHMHYDSRQILKIENNRQNQHQNQSHQYEQKVHVQSQPLAKTQINEFLLSDNQVSERFVRSKLTQYLNQQQMNTYRQTPEVQLMDIPKGHREMGEMGNIEVKQCQDKNQDIKIESNSFKNVFYPQTPQLINLQQYPTVHSSRKSLGIHSLQTSQHAADLPQNSDDFNPTPLTIVKIQDKQVKPEKKIIFKKMLVANKLHLNPRLAASTVYSEIAKEPTPINSKINIKQDASKQNRSPKIASPQVSKVNFKSMLQKNRNSKSGSPDSRQYLSPKKEVAKSQLNFKLLIGFFHQN